MKTSGGDRSASATRHTHREAPPRGEAGDETARPKRSLPAPRHRHRAQRGDPRTHKSMSTFPPPADTTAPTPKRAPQSQAAHPQGMSTQHPPDNPSHLRERSNPCTTQPCMTTIQDIATRDRLRATRQANPQASRPPQTPKAIQRPTLPTRCPIEQREVKSPALKALFLSLAALTLAFSLYTPTINTTPLTCTPHLAIPAPSPYIPSPQPHDWIGALHDTLAARNQRETKRARAAPPSDSTAPRSRPSDTNAEGTRLFTRRAQTRKTTPTSFIGRPQAREAAGVRPLGGCERLIAGRGSVGMPSFAHE